MRKSRLRKEINRLLEDDEISSAEAGFMLGYFDDEA